MERLPRAQGSTFPVLFHPHDAWGSTYDPFSVAGEEPAVVRLSDSPWSQGHPVRGPGLGISSVCLASLAVSMTPDGPTRGGKRGRGEGHQARVGIEPRPARAAGWPPEDGALEQLEGLGLTR